MTKTIWKFEMEIDDTQVINMPKGAEILSIQLQNNEPVIWALVNPEEPDKEPRQFEMFGTGYLIPCDISINRKFLGTIQPIGIGSSFSFAFHIFERLY
jgi:hypothetical protein